MVRGRRVRAVVACDHNNDGYSPKKKEQRLELPGKLSHAVITPSKKQEITQYFKVTNVQKRVTNKTIVTEIKHDKLFCYTPVKNNAKCVKIDQAADELCQEKDAVPVIVDGMQTIDDSIKSPSTPHRIELCSDSNDLPAIKKTDTQIVLLPEKQVPSNAKRKLNSNQSCNQQPTVKQTQSVLKKSDKSTNNHKLTEYFPVRRSERKTKKIVQEEKQRDLEQILRNNIEKGLLVKNFEGKGRGVVAARPFSRGDFVVEYSGQLIDIGEAKCREQEYAQDQNTGCYMYYFKYQSQQYCVDATAETGRLGRLVNHSRNGNLLTRTVLVDGIPRLVLVAKDDIEVGEEITYDYGDRSKESLKNHPWLAY